MSQGAASEPDCRSLSTVSAATPQLPVSKACTVRLHPAEVSNEASHPQPQWRRYASHQRAEPAPCRITRLVGVNVEFMMGKTPTTRFNSTTLSSRNRLWSSSFYRNSHFTPKSFFQFIFHSDLIHSPSIELSHPAGLVQDCGTVHLTSDVAALQGDIIAFCQAASV